MERRRDFCKKLSVNDFNENIFTEGGIYKDGPEI